MTRLLIVLAVVVGSSTSAQAQRVDDRTCAVGVTWADTQAGQELTVTATITRSRGGWVTSIIQDAADKRRFTCRESHSGNITILPVMTVTTVATFTVMGNPVAVSGVDGQGAHGVPVNSLSCKRGLTSEQKAMHLSELTAAWLRTIARNTNISAGQDQIKRLIDYFHEKVDCL